MRNKPEMSRQWVVDEIKERGFTLLTDRSVNAAVGLLALGLSREAVSADLFNWNEDLKVKRDFERELRQLRQRRRFNA